MTYEKRLNHLKLHALLKGRVRGDLNEVYKWIKSFHSRDANKGRLQQRWTGLVLTGKLDALPFNKDMNRKRITNREEGEWNRLKCEVPVVMEQDRTRNNG